MCGEHFINAVVVLFCKNGQLPGLLFLEPLQDRFVLTLWCSLQQVIPQCFILPGLDLARVLELLLYLELFRLDGRVGNNRKTNSERLFTL